VVPTNTECASTDSFSGWRRGATDPLQPYANFGLSDRSPPPVTGRSPSTSRRSTAVESSHWRARGARRRATGSFARAQPRAHDPMLLPRGLGASDTFTPASSHQLQRVIGQGATIPQSIDEGEFEHRPRTLLDAGAQSRRCGRVSCRPWAWRRRAPELLLAVIELRCSRARERRTSVALSGGPA